MAVWESKEKRQLNKSQIDDVLVKFKSDVNQRTRRQNPDSKKERMEITNFTQDFIPIRDIRHGIIETTDKRFIKILEVEPQNFLLLSTREQLNIVYAFSNWLKVANVKLQFKSITKKADTEKFIETLNADMHSEINDKTKSFSKAYINLIRDTGASEALTRRFFIVMEFEPTETKKSSDYEEVFRSLEHASRIAKKFLHQCGNKVKEYANEDLFLQELLYMIFNRKSSETETFNQRVKRITEDVMQEKGRDGIDEQYVISPINYIAPRGLDLTNSDYVVMDGLYYSFIYIKKNGYPLHVTAGWMSSIINLGEGVDVDIFFQKESKEKIRKNLARYSKYGGAKFGTAHHNDEDFHEIREAQYSTDYIREAVNVANQDLFWMTTLITISAPTLELLDSRVSEIISSLKGQDFDPVVAVFEQEKALLSSLPLLNLDPSIAKRANRNILTRSAASAYMFSSFEICDDDGILLGINGNNGSLCVLDLFNTKAYKNANMVVVGTAGAGKTFTLQLIALRMRMKGIQVFIIAPFKGHEFKRACDAIGGEYVDLGLDSRTYVNIMEIRPPDHESRKLLDPTYQEGSLLTKKMQQLHTFFSLMIPDMSPVEFALLDAALDRVYAMHNITKENKSLYDEDGNLRPMPTLFNLLARLEDQRGAENIVAILKTYTKGSARSFSNQTNVNLDNKYIVLDVSKLQDEHLLLGMFIALDFVWDKAQEDMTKKKVIIIDEVWKLIGASSTPRTANFVLEIFKIIRGYGGSAIGATQELTDFFALEDGKYGNGVINNSKTKIILNLEQKEAESVQEILGLSSVEIRNIVGFEQGNALLIANNNKVTLQIRPSREEKRAITTDRSELEAIAYENKMLLEQQNANN